MGLSAFLALLYCPAGWSTYEILPYLAETVRANHEYYALQTIIMLARNIGPQDCR
jgi:hypothetical protein